MSDFDNAMHLDVTGVEQDPMWGATEGQVALRIRAPCSFGDMFCICQLGNAA